MKPLKKENKVGSHHTARTPCLPSKLIIDPFQFLYTTTKHSNIIFYGAYLFLPFSRNYKTCFNKKSESSVAVSFRVLFNNFFALFIWLFLSNLLQCVASENSQKKRSEKLPKIAKKHSKTDSYTTRDSHAL